MLVDQIYAMGYLYHFEWGCPDGVHCAWAIIEAESHAQALACCAFFAAQQGTCG